jgi:hypothetical protein
VETMGNRVDSIQQQLAWILKQSTSNQFGCQKLLSF